LRLLADVLAPRHFTADQRRSPLPLPGCSCIVLPACVLPAVQGHRRLPLPNAVHVQPRVLHLHRRPLPQQVGGGLRTLRPGRVGLWGPTLCGPRCGPQSVS
jgi:hypothetical protein